MSPSSANMWAMPFARQIVPRDSSLGKQSQPHNEGRRRHCLTPMPEEQEASTRPLRWSWSLVQHITGTEWAGLADGAVPLSIGFI